jgi:four helix bundle protein
VVFAVYSLGMQDFRRLDVINKVRPFAVLVYEVTKAFPASEKYGMTAQMRRAVIGIGLAIAEGCGRGTTPDLIRFLTYANGSAEEVEFGAVQSIDLGFASAEALQPVIDGAQLIQKMLCALIAALRRRLAAQQEAKTRKRRGYT